MILLNEINFEFAEAFKPLLYDILENKHTRYAIPGGRDSGKSTFVYMLVILTVLNFGNVAIYRQYKTTLKKSCYNGIVKLINKYKLTNLFKIRKSPLQIECLANGYTIDFSGLDSFQKEKSVESITGNYKLVIFEESQEIPRRDICDEVISSYERGEGSDGFKVIWVFNPPPNKNHWTNLELRKSDESQDLMVQQVNYTDIPAEWVGKQQLKEIERIKKSNLKLYRYRYLGEPISAEDVIFENLKFQRIPQSDIDKWEQNDDWLFNGLDFGYYPDKNAAVSCHYDPDKRILYIYREFYQGKLNNFQISQGLERSGFDKGSRIICDNASPKDIADLRAFGWNVRPSTKGNGSVKDGFQWLMGLSAIIIDPYRCPDTKQEFEEYHYELDRDGGIPDSKLYKWNQKDHSISAVRYATEPIRRKGGY